MTAILTDVMRDNYVEVKPLHRFEFFVQSKRRLKRGADKRWASKLEADENAGS